MKRGKLDIQEGLLYIEPTIHAIEGLTAGISQVFYFSAFFCEPRVFLPSLVGIG